MADAAIEWFKLRLIHWSHHKLRSIQNHPFPPRLFCCSAACIIRCSVWSYVSCLKMSETWGNCFGSLRSYVVSILDSDVILSSTQCVWRSQADGEIPEIFQRSLHLGRIVAFLIVPVFRGGTWQRRHVATATWPRFVTGIVPSRFWPACGRNVLRPLLTSPWKSLKNASCNTDCRNNWDINLIMIKKTSVQEYHEISWNKMKCVLRFWSSATAHMSWHEDGQLQFLRIQCQIKPAMEIHWNPCDIHWQISALKWNASKACQAHMSPPSSFSFLLTSSFVDTDDRLNPS